MSSFISSRDIEAAKVLKKQKKREQRYAILKQAKIDYQNKEIREEPVKKEWMAPGLVSRFSEADDRTSSRSSNTKKEKKKKKKSKKNTRKDTKKRSRSTSSDFSSSESDGGDWIEKAVDTANESIIQRESWMTTQIEPSGRTIESSLEQNSQKEVREFLWSYLSTTTTTYSSSLNNS